MKPLPSESQRAGRLLLCAIGALVLVRLVSLACYPLMDQTEARYADIARRMVDSGDWVTPWIGDGVPFWGKPPLSFWATALGFELFGVNELAARLPHLLLGAGVAGLVWQHARQATQRAAWHGVALLGGSALFLVSSGAVMTDMALTLGTTLVMVGFWRALHAEAGGRAAAWQMLLGVVIGLLAKGPVSVILWGVPVLAWVLLTGRLGLVWRRIAWLRGAAIVLALSLPWYLWAEARSPGFLRYFIVGEHWHRFVTPGWSGDLYGSAHQFPRGSIWVFALGAVMPWPVLLALAWLVARRPASRPVPASGAAADDGARGTGGAGVRAGEASYLWAWALTPCLFFSAAGNILWTYVLPGLPALALLVGYWTSTRARQAWAEGALTLGIVICSVAILALLAGAPASGLMEQRSAKSLVADYRANALPHQPLYFLGRVPFSGSFYSHGKARALADIGARPVGPPVFLILDELAFNALGPELRERVMLVSTRGGRVLARMQ